MCGRFYVDDEMRNEIDKICKKIDQNYHQRAGDIRPSEESLVIRKDSDNELCAMSGIWGYQWKESKKLLINARVETIHLRPAFRNDYKYHRCVIPISGFYEWNREKVQFRCRPLENQKVIYLAGIYSGTDQGSRFTIITTQANEKMRVVHDRMPVMIPREKLEDWLVGIEINQKENQDFQMERVKKEEYQQLRFL